jgi:hypothetical protein
MWITNAGFAGLFTPVWGRPLVLCRRVVLGSGHQVVSTFSFEIHNFPANVHLTRVLRVLVFF